MQPSEPQFIKYVMPFLKKTSTKQTLFHLNLDNSRIKSKRKHESLWLITLLSNLKLESSKEGKLHQFMKRTYYFIIFR